MTAMRAVRWLRGSAAMTCLAMATIAAPEPLAQTLPPSTTVTQDLQPKIVPITLGTVPGGLFVRVNGQPVTGGQSVNSWQGWSVTLFAPPQTIGMPTYYFDNWSDGGASTHPVVTPAAAATITATFSTTAPPSADIDANGAYDALTDGLLLLRHLFGLSGPALTAGALGASALRTAPGEIGAFVAGQGLAFDVDGNGSVDALTDGLLVIRYLFGLRGSALVAGAVGVGAVRTTAAQIEPFIASLLR